MTQNLCITLGIPLSHNTKIWIWELLHEPCLIQNETNNNSNQNISPESDEENIMKIFIEHFPMNSEKSSKFQSNEESEEVKNDKIDFKKSYSLEFPKNRKFRKTKNDPPPKIFEVFYPEKEPSSNDDDNSNDVYLSENNRLLVKKRLNIRRQRKENSDNIRKKIKRFFFNAALLHLLNNNLKCNYFERFPPSFVCDVEKTRNNNIINMTLLEIIENINLYKKENKVDMEKYLHNLKTVQSEEVKQNEEIKKILNKTFKELYEEYLNSKEFKKKQINKLKKKKMSDDYIARFINTARNLIKFFSS